MAQALNGKAPPRSGSNEYTALYLYMRQDSEFKAAITKANPMWTIKTRVGPPKNTAKYTGIKYRALLVVMAERGEARPKSNTREGRALHFLKKRDAAFNEFIKLNRPDWISHNNLEVHANLLNMIYSGKSLPRSDIREYKRFKYLTMEGSLGYNSDFVAMAKEKAPMWFIKKGKHV